jgi:hypothetical protein
MVASQLPTQKSRKSGMLFGMVPLLRSVPDGVTAQPSLAPDRPTAAPLGTFLASLVRGG